MKTKLLIASLVLISSILFSKYFESDYYIDSVSSSQIEQGQTKDIIISGLDIHSLSQFERAWAYTYLRFHPIFSSYTNTGNPEIKINSIDINDDNSLTANISVGENSLIGEHVLTYNRHSLYPSINITPSASSPALLISSQSENKNITQGNTIDVILSGQNLDLNSYTSFGALSNLTFSPIFSSYSNFINRPNSYGGYSPIDLTRLSDNSVKATIQIPSNAPSTQYGVFFTPSGYKSYSTTLSLFPAFTVKPNSSNPALLSATPKNILVNPDEEQSLDIILSGQNLELQKYSSLTNLSDFISINSIAPTGYTHLTLNHSNVKIIDNNTLKTTINIPQPYSNNSRGLILGEYGISLRALSGPEDISLFPAFNLTTKNINSIFKNTKDENNLKVYPTILNTGDNLNIYSKDKLLNVSILNTSGQTLHTIENIKENKLHLPKHLTPNTYIIIVNTDNGSFSEKIIIN